MDKTRQNARIFGEILFFKATHNTKINEQLIYLFFASCKLEGKRKEEGTQFIDSKVTQPNKYDMWTLMDDELHSWKVSSDISLCEKFQTLSVPCLLVVLKLINANPR